jgi:hypothetical protein
MAAFDVGLSKDHYVDPEKAHDSEFIQALERVLKPNVFARIVKTIDEALDNLKPSAKSKLVFTRMAALFGHNNIQPKRWEAHLWDNVVHVVGDGKECLLAIGSMLRWRVSVRPETWLVYKQVTEDEDPETGKKISVSHYWIDEEFIPNIVKKKERSLELDIKGLEKAWGTRA